MMVHAALAGLYGGLVVAILPILGAGWLLLSEYRSAFTPGDAERLTNVYLWLSLAWACGALVTVLPRLRHHAWAHAWAGALALAALLAASGRQTGGSVGRMVTRAPSQPRGVPDDVGPTDRKSVV